MAEWEQRMTGPDATDRAAAGVTVRVAVRAAARVGEGPVWDPGTGLLWWVDIPAGLVHASRPGTGELTTRALPMQVGAVAPATSGGLVVACETGFGLLGADGSFDVRQPVLLAGERMNDGKCDAAGRFWAGSTDMTFTPGRGRLHVLHPDWHSEVVLDGLTLPNGMGWSPDSSVFYLADSVQQLIYAFAFDLRAGTLSGRRTLIDLTERDGMPDGLCVDTAGCLWVAMWGGFRVLRVSPLGEILASVEMPVQQPSSCAFGGQRLDVLYVTSARDGLELASDAADGSVFALARIGAAGTPPTLFGA